MRANPRVRNCSYSYPFSYSQYSRKILALLLSNSVWLAISGCMATAEPAGPGTPSPVVVATTSLPSGTLGKIYAATLVASRGKAPYQWAVTDGSLPSGLVLDSISGTIGGIPSAEGTYAFGVQVQDSKRRSASAHLKITISAPSSSTSSSPASPGLAIGTSVLPAGTVGTAYGSPVGAVGGAPPYQWSLAVGSLPAGLNLSASSGVISGLPATAGTVTFTVQVQDSKQNVATAHLGITINPSSGSASNDVPALQVTTNALAGGTMGTPYSASLAATGGTPPYRWSATAGSLPAGLSLTANTATISGTPSVPGKFSFTVGVTDSSTPLKSALGNISMVISPTEVPPGSVMVTSFGARGDGITDDTTAISAAIQSLQPDQTLYFPCGTYAISSALSTISVSNVAVEGPAPGTGANCATLKLTGGASFTALQLSGGGLSQSENLVADTTSNTFTVGSGGLAAIGITAGSYAMISDVAVASNGSGSPLIANQEVIKVVGISGDTATIENTFSYKFTMVSPYPNSQGCCPYVQKVSNPLTGVTVRYLNMDASSNAGASTRALVLANATNSEVGSLQISNFLGTGASGGVRLQVGYQNSLHDIICSKCGNGGANGYGSVDLIRESFPVVQNITITNTAVQSVFSFSLRMTHFGTVDNVYVDAGGASGRPIKLLRSSNNTISNATAKNGTGGHNGISVTDISTYNIFNNCVALNNTNIGIATFGNHNVHNTFNNCTAKFNDSWQFGQIHGADGSYADYFTTINGGTFCCARDSSTIVQNNSDHFTITNATISDDQGAATNGLVVNSTNAIVENNTFSGLPAGRDIYAINAISPTFSGNSTPDGTSPNSLATLFRKLENLFAEFRLALPPSNHRR
jgi:hypothetical protein